jgi:DNA-binding beta-propeller fold protein YncE
MLVAVPCAGADCLLLLDGADGSERGRIPVGAHPVHLADVAGAVFVATMGERSISVVAEGDVSRVDVGTLGPSHFGVTDDGRVLVPCTGGDSLAIVDREALALADRVGVGAEPHDVAVHDGLAFVGSRADGTVAVVDPAAGRPLETIDLGDGARIQGVDAGFGAVYAVDQAGGRVARVTEDGVSAVAAVGANPYEATIDARHLFVPGRDDGSVTELDPALSDRRTHDVGGRPLGIVPADGDPWVLNRERPLLRSLSGERTFDLPAPAFAGAAIPGTDDLVITHYDDDRVSRISPKEAGTVWTVDTPAEPFEPLAI